MKNAPKCVKTKHNERQLNPSSPPLAVLVGNPALDDNAPSIPDANDDRTIVTIGGYHDSGPTPKSGSLKTAPSSKTKKQ